MDAHRSLMPISLAVCIWWQHGASPPDWRGVILCEKSMETPEFYRQRADEAERLAKESKDALAREAYERIARGWRDLGQQSMRRVAQGL